MNNREKKHIVRQLCNGIKAQIIAEIDAGKIPEDWDGFELRWLVETKAARHAPGKVFANYKRFRKYQNTIRTTIL